MLNIKSVNSLTPAQPLDSQVNKQVVILILLL